MARHDVPTLAFEVHEKISLTVIMHGQASPTVPEWDAYIDALGRARCGPEGMRILVITGGGRPARAQQAQMAAVMSGISARTAVVSSSIAVSFVISMIALLTPGVRGFAPSQLGGALDYLELDRNDRAVADLAVRRLSRKLDLQAPDASALGA